MSIDLSIQRARERQNAMSAIDWTERAIYAIEKSDYPAAWDALGVALKYIEACDENCKKEARDDRS